MNARLPTDSPPSAATAVRYRFGPFVVDPSAARLERRGAEVALEPKVFRVLVFLIERRHRVVSRRELLDGVWDDTIVTENALTRAIARLRRVLGDRAREPRFIETAHTLGYRFVAEIEELGGGSGPGGAGPSPRARRRGGLVAVGGLLLLVAGALVWQAGSAGDMSSPEPAGVDRKPAAPTARLAQITRSPGLDLFPAFSPEGAALVYTSARSGSLELYVRQLQRGAKELQLTDDGRGNVQPAWSPDGQLIAYHSRRAGGIWLVPALGGRPRRLTELGSDPAWSPDGKLVVFQTGALTGVTPEALPAQPPSTLWLVTLDGRPPRPLTRPHQPPAGHGAPVFSADGRRVIFTSKGESHGLWSVEVDGTDLARLLRGPILDPALGGAGSEVLFAAQHPESPTEHWIWRLAFPNEGPSGALPVGRRLGPPDDGWPPVPVLRARARHLAVSRDGSRLAYSGYEQRSNVWSLPLDAQTGRAAGEPRPLTRDTNERNTGPAFSPDGRRIAYLANQVGARHSIWILSSDGAGRSELIDSGPLTSAGHPTWLDNGRLGYVAGDWGYRRLRITDLDTGAARDLLPIPAAWRVVRLSPDGLQLAFHAVRGGVANVFVADLTAEDIEPRQVTFDPELAGYPRWSPDSRHLAVEIQRGPDTHVAVVDLETGSSRIVVEEAGQSWPEDWSAAGRLLYAGSRDGIWNLYWVDLASGHREQLTRFDTLHTYVRYPVWSPLGDQVVFEYGEIESDVWLAELGAGQPR